MRINQVMTGGLCNNEENKIRFKIHRLKLRDSSLKKERIPEKETKWYRCTNREEMLLLIQAGFDYINNRKDKHNDGKNTYFFERTKELEKYVSENQINNSNFPYRFRE